MALKSLEEKHPIDHIITYMIYENDHDDDDDNEWGENDCDGDDNWAGVARTEVSSTGERAGKIEKHVSASSWSWNDGQDNDYDENNGYIENNDYDESDGHYVDDDAKADISLKI